MDFAMIPCGLAAIHDQPIGTFQAERVQFALCIVVGSNSGNVLARAQPLSLYDRFPGRCRRDENLRGFNYVLDAVDNFDLDSRQPWRESPLQSERLFAIAAPEQKSFEFALQKQCPRLPVSLYAGAQNASRKPFSYLHPFAEPELESLPIQCSVDMCLMPQEKPVKDLAANPSPVQK